MKLKLKSLNQKTMKIKHAKKTYEYDYSSVLMETETKNKIVKLAKEEDLTIKAFMKKLVNTYEN